MVTSNDSPVLTASNVSKKYCRNLKRSFRYGAQDIVRELAGTRSKELRKGEFWALQDVSFSLFKGQSLGLIGSNGSGKTTLLKILSGLIKPNEGEVRIRGRVAPLLALGAGFNPILSGRENIYINLTLLGLNRRQIDERLNAIVDFAEVWEAIDAPLRTYSSGMSARLGFACAIHTDPDILFVDEVLAVGDARFRTKCYQRLAELRSRGSCLILVSHSHNAILSACERALYISKGKMIYLGPSDEALKLYEADLQKMDLENIPQDLALSKKLRKDFEIVEVYCEDEYGQRTKVLASGKQASLVIRFNGNISVEKLSATVIIRDRAMKLSEYLSLHSAIDGRSFHYEGGAGTIRLFLPQCGIRPGKYMAKISLVSGSNYNVLDMIEGFLLESASENFIGPSIYYQPREWTFSKEIAGPGL